MEYGIYKQAFTRIFVHLKKSTEFGQNLDLNDFKDNWTKFNGRKGISKHIKNNKVSNKEQFLKDLANNHKKYITKKKAQN